MDAAKYVSQEDLLALRARVHQTVDHEDPLWALDVEPGGTGVLRPRAFLETGTLLGYDYAARLRKAFKGSTPGGKGAIASLRGLDKDAALLPSGSTTVFVVNHETERRGGSLSYRDGATNLLAHHFLLAYPYGRPQVYSAFTWDKRDDSPPSDALGKINDTDCGEGWS